MENALSLEAVFPVVEKVLRLSKPIALVLNRCTKPSFSFTVVCVCACIHAQRLLLSPSFTWLIHCDVPVLPPPCFSFQSLETNSTLGVLWVSNEAKSWGVLNTVTGWQSLCRERSDGDRFSVVLITSYLLSSVGFAHQQDTFPGLFSSCWVYGLEVECCGVMGLSLVTLGFGWCGICLHSWLAVLQTTVAQLRISSNKEFPKSDAVPVSLFSSSDWLCKVVVPVASSQWNWVVMA